MGIPSTVSFVATVISSALTVDARMLDVCREELYIKGTYRLDCIIVLTADKLRVVIFLEVSVEAIMEDVWREEL